MATIRDVAGLAGVSISTVSLAMNTPERVSPETRQRIAEAALKVGFAANPFAQNLKRGRSRLIAMVVADITNPFFGRLLREVEHCAMEADYLVVVCDTHGSAEHEKAILQHLDAQRVAGIILSPLGSDGTNLEVLRGLDMPLVLFDHRLSGIASDYVGTDNELASAMLTEHLVRLGHRRIGYIGGASGLYTAEKRREGFEATLRAHAVAPVPELMLDGRYDAQGGYDAAMRLLTQPRDRPTAIIAASNVMAIGALQACNELAIDCPADMSIAGIDDVPWGAVIRPRITAAVQPVGEMARAACEMLLERIAARSGPDPDPRSAIFAPRLVMGHSTAAPRAAASRPTVVSTRPG